MSSSKSDGVGADPAAVNPEPGAATDNTALGAPTDIQGNNARTEAAPPVPPDVPAATAGWPALRLPGRTDLPSFPLHTLADWHRGYVTLIARWKHVSPDAPAMQSLAMIGAAGAKRADVWIGGDERHPVNIWVIGVSPSGAGKSPIEEELERPFAAVQQELVSDCEARINATKVERKVAEQRYRTAIRECAKAATDAERAEALDEARRLDEEVRRLAPDPKVALYTEDTTPEALAQLLADNFGAMALFSDEGSTLFTNVMRRSVDGIDNIEVLLKAHSGTTLTVNRLTRPPLLIREPALSIAIATQGRTFSKLIRRESFLGRGLWERFLIVVPQSQVGRRSDRSRLYLHDLRALRGAYVGRIRALLGLPVKEEGDGRLRLRLTLAAQQFFDTFCEDIDRRMAAGGDLAPEPVQAWSNKVRTNVLRLSAILFLSECDTPIGCDPTERVELGVDVLQRAVEIMTYCLAHAKSVLGNTTPLATDVEVALEWLTTTRPARFRVRTLQRARQATFPRAAQLDIVIDRLVEMGAVRAAAPPGGRGRPADEYEVNPELFAQGIPVTK